MIRVFNRGVLVAGLLVLALSAPGLGQENRDQQREPGTKRPGEIVHQPQSDRQEGGKRDQQQGDRGSARHEGDQRQGDRGRPERPRPESGS